MRTYALEGTGPLYARLYTALRDDILSGAIAGGEKLPSKRALAEHLNLSVITVETAYAQLLAEGYVISRPRSGYYAQTLQTLPPPAPAAVSPVPVEEKPAPGAGAFPFSVWARLMRSVLLEEEPRLLRPAPNLGLEELRRAIAASLGSNRGFAPDPGCIVIGAGAEYLYNLLIQLLGRDRAYGLEDPGHQKIAQVYRANGVRICPVPLDEFGVQADALEQSPATVMHLSPGHQFPTGIVTPIGRRQQLMAWLAGGDRWLIEDDYDSEFRFAGKPIPTMFSMDNLGRVIYMNTFSKTISPALRISYMILPPALMARYRETLGFYSCTVPVMEQLTLARFIDGGFFARHVSRMKRQYRLLRDEFLQGLRACAGAEKITVRGHEAGLHMLLQLESSRSDQELEALLAAAGARSAALGRYQISPEAKWPRGCMVVSFSELTADQLPALLAALERAVS